MNYEMHYFEVFPQIVCADKVSVIRIRPKFAAPRFPDGIPVVDVFPVNGQYGTSRFHNFCEYETSGDRTLRKICREGETLLIHALFPGEQSHAIRVEMGGYAVCFPVYSLKPDLFALRPFRGDFHIHSSESDGVNDPAYIPARFRKEGVDFIAITDHRKMKPSQKAISAWADLKIGFQIYSGEELHLPNNPVHMLNFGGSFSVNALAYEQKEKYYSEVREIAMKLSHITEGNRFITASCEWAFRQIRKGGGISVFCHPYWRIPHAQHVISESLVDDILSERKFDVYEVVGGKDLESWDDNNLQMIRYYAEQAKGNRFPCIAVSDSHHADSGKRTGWYSTVVLARTDSFTDLAESLKKGLCGAVRTVTNEQPEVIGENLRLSRYFIFLVKNYFPKIREICEPEGFLMTEALSGNANSRKLLSLRGNETEKFRECFFGNNFPVQAPNFEKESNPCNASLEKRGAFDS